MKAKNADDWPMKSPMSVKNLSAPVATPFVSVGRMIEHGATFRLRNGHGSGHDQVRPEILARGGQIRKCYRYTGTGSIIVNGGAWPALSDQVWKCMVSVGPMPPIEATFGSEEIAIPVKCNKHPWMKGYIAVFKHPYFAVTGKDGGFVLKGLPAGTYTQLRHGRRDSRH